MERGKTESRSLALNDNENDSKQSKKLCKLHANQGYADPCKASSWRFSCELVLNDLSQPESLHGYGRSPVCVRMCTVKPTRKRKREVQPVARKIRNERESMQGGKVSGTPDLQHCKQRVGNPCARASDPEANLCAKTLDCSRGRNTHAGQGKIP